MGHGETAGRLLCQGQVELGPTSLQAAARRAQDRPPRAAVLLMGCNTARPAVPEGLEHEAFSLPLALLAQGVPAVVGTLWDVLGGDLDRVARALLERWAGQAAGPGGGGPSALPRATLAAALAAARPACHLPHLTGAAVVCYAGPS
ncbi:unnamed protein product [Prorocentrum cordatum]|nr:unnamed protein product [Polarella glacialis]